MDLLWRRQMNRDQRGKRAGFTGGPITTSGSLSIAASGVTNGMLANSSLTVKAGTGLSGGGAVSLGGSITLNNAGVLSVRSCRRNHEQRWSESKPGHRRHDRAEVGQ